MRNLLFIALFLSLILFSACEFLGYDEEIAKIVKSGDPDDCDALTAEDAAKTQTRIERCYDSYAQRHEMPELCAKIQKESTHDDCYEGLAEKTENLDLCAQLKGNSDDCISKVGIAKNDESICAQLQKGSAKDRCNQEIAKEKKSLEICELVESSTYKDDCLRYIALEEQDVSICEKSSRYSKDSCVQQLAVSMKDISLCDHSTDKDRCVENVKTVIEPQDNINLDDEDIDDEVILDELEDETTEPGVHEVDGKLYINSVPDEVLRLTALDIPAWAYAQIVVVGATAVCTGPSSTIVTGDSSVLLEGHPIARLNDDTSHGGKIVEGSDKIFINGVPAAFLGAQTVCPMVTGVVPHVGGPISTLGH